MNLVDQLTHQSERRPDSPALSLMGRTVSYQELERLVWRCSGALHRRGARRGDVLALSFGTEFPLAVTMLAVARMGATVLSVPAHYPSVMRTKMARQAGARYLVRDEASPDIQGLLTIRLDAKQLGPEVGGIDPGIRDPDPSAPFLIITGSGSTGTPKLFSVTHPQFHARSKATADAIGLSESDRVISMSRLDFTSPKERFLSTLLVGATFVLFERKAVDLVRFCRSLGVTVMNACVYDMEKLLMNLPEDAKTVLSSLRVLQVSSSTVSPRLRRRMTDKISRNLYVRYATNETGLISVASPTDVLDPPDGVGHPVSGASVEIVDRNGWPMPLGKIGQIRLQSPGMIQAYLGNQEASERAFRDGWFLPGDLGRLLPDGQLVHCGRSDHMMIMNGINIYPAEIERALLAHPDVRDAAALPLPSGIHQDLPVCAVTLAPSTSATQQSLLMFARAQLGPRGPQSIVLLDEIPRDGRGKLMRERLLNQIVSALRNR